MVDFHIKRRLFNFFTIILALIILGFLILLGTSYLMPKCEGVWVNGECKGLGLQIPPQ